MGIFFGKEEIAINKDAYKITIHENGNKVLSYDIRNYEWIAEDYLRIELADGRAIDIRPGYNCTVIIE